MNYDHEKARIRNEILGKERELRSLEEEMTSLEVEERMNQDYVESLSDEAMEGRVYTFFFHWARDVLGAYNGDERKARKLLLEAADSKLGLSSMEDRAKRDRLKGAVLHALDDARYHVDIPL